MERLTDDDWRRIFVVRDGEQVHLFDDAETGFLEEWRNGYYTNAPSELRSLLPALEDEAEEEVVEEETQHGARVRAYPRIALAFPSISPAAFGFVPRWQERSRSILLRQLAPVCSSILA